MGLNNNLVQAYPLTLADYPVDWFRDIELIRKSRIECIAMKIEGISRSPVPTPFRFKCVFSLHLLYVLGRDRIGLLTE